MTFCQNCLRLAPVLTAVVLAGVCQPLGAQSFGKSFNPSAPAESVETVPASVPANPWISTSTRSSLDASPRPSQVDLRLKRADDRFQRGRELYNQGDSAGARLEFDAAVDLLLGTPENLPDRHKVETRLEQLVLAIHKFDVNRLGAGDFSSEPTWDKAPLEDILDLTFPIDPGLKPRVTEQLRATVSQLPLEMNDSVGSYINYFSSERGRRTLLFGLRRAGRYKPLISKILAEEGVPQELIYLAQAESGFMPRAVSHKAAVGMWQFVQARGREYGLMQTRYTDDRLDPEKATRSAARHLRDLFNKFGDWYLAIAGYNCGDGCIEKAVQRTGYADFWELRARNAIPRETTNYVPIIVAMTIMAKNAKDYGLENVETDPPLQFENIEVEAPTHVALIADAADRPVSEVRDLNPALLGNVAPSGYSVHIPAGTRTQVAATLGTIPAERRASWRIHRVSGGDTIEAIARRYRMSPSAIESANGVTDAEPGDVLIIPTASELERSAKKVTSAKSKSRSSKTVVAKGKKPASATAAKTTAKKQVTARKAPATSTARGTARASLR